MTTHFQPPAHTARQGFAEEWGALRRLLSGHWIHQAIYVVAKLKIADHLAAGPVKVSELSALTKSDERALYRILRAAASVGVLTETAEGFALTALAQYLRTDHPTSLRPIAIFQGESWHWHIWEQLLYCAESGRPAFEKVFGCDFFSYVRDKPGAARIFNDAMTALSRAEHAAILDAVDLSGITHLVDIGGGHGHLLARILQANPAMSATLLERRPVADGARRTFEELQLADRCTVVGGDFFESVPPGDAYLLKHVLHDWDDGRAIQILRACRRAISPRGRLIIAEAVIPEGNGFSFAKLLDLQMLACTTGTERSAPQYSAILAHTGFCDMRITPTMTETCAIEAIADT